MVKSMTGYAARTGTGEGATWAWELRAVNARGLDVRLRLPDWIEGLEPLVRARMAKAAARGNLSLSLKISRDDMAEALTLDSAALSAALERIAEVQAAAEASGVSLAPPTATDILSIRGVMETTGAETGTEALRRVLMADLEGLITAFNTMRADEGAALHAILTRQMGEIAGLVTAAATEAEQQNGRAEATLTAALKRVTDAVEVDSARVAQELAVLAVKADVTEEIDRLKAHVTATEALLSKDGPIGRKLDFLAQEFNREANTLCSKSQSPALTRVGLDLKATIDQMREQVQNVE